MGVDGYLPKPIIHGELHDLLGTLLSADIGKDSGEGPVTRHTVLENRTRLSILVAEDVPVNQEVIRHILARYGHAVSVVDTGEKVVEAWKVGAGAFDLIIMDVQMPVMDGLQATRRIRELEQVDGSHVPIVAMTAYAMKGDRERCLEAGMDDYLSKPFRSDEIGTLLERYAGRCAERRLSQDPVVSRGKTSIQAIGRSRSPAFNLSALTARIGGDRGLVDKFVGMFVLLVDETLPELEKSIADRDGEMVRATLHTLKGAAGNVGADRMHDLAVELHLLVKKGDVGCITDGVSILRREFEQFKEAAGAVTEGGRMNSCETQ